MTTLTHLFPNADFKHHLTLRRGLPDAFFVRVEGSGHALAERARWLAQDPERYAALRPEGEPIIAEFAEMARGWGALGAAADPLVEPPASGIAQLLRLGRALEPDILFLNADESGKFRLRGGALCFPTGWALAEKLGHPLDFIHGVVPGLNAALSSPIDQFLSKMKPGIAFFRDNWGISASAELNQHPVRSLRAPALPLTLDQLWLRVEHQALLMLPRTGGIVFGIRISNHRIDQLRSNTELASGLARALRTMPESMVAYKRLDDIRTELVSALTR